MATEEACDKDVAYWAALVQMTFAIPGAFLTPRLADRRRRPVKAVAVLFSLWLMAFLTAL